MIRGCISRSNSTLGISGILQFINGNTQRCLEVPYGSVDSCGRRIDAPASPAAAATASSASCSAPAATADRHRGVELAQLIRNLFARLRFGPLRSEESPF